ncbi:MAG: glycosyltransferase family 39 protein [Pyrinomonadaceae bacterium]
MTLGHAESPSPNPDEPAFDGHSVGRHSLVVFAAVVFLFIAARLWRLTASCLWFDEIFSVHASRHSWGDLLSFVAADIIHPPIFYMLLKAWIAIGGESLLWLRLLPALVGILSFIPFVLLCRELNRTLGETNLALLLMAVNGYLIKYAQEVRMYSLLFFLSLCSLWLFVRLLKAEATSRKQLLALSVINLLLVYTHYSGWLMVVLQTVAVLLWRSGKLKLFLMSVAVLFVGYIPWLYEIARIAREPSRELAQNIGWVTRPHLQDVIQYFTLMNKPFLSSQSNVDVTHDPMTIGLSVLLFGLPILFFLFRLFQPGKEAAQRPGGLLRALLFFALAPGLLVFFLSWMLPYSIWGTRHLIVASGPYFLLAALSWTQLRPSWTRITVVLVFGCWALLTGTFFLFRRPPVFIWCAWEQLADQVARQEANSTDAVRVYAFEDLVAYHVWFSLENSHSERFKVVMVKGIPGLVEDPAYFLPRSFSDIESGDRSALQGRPIWLAFRDTRWNDTRPPINVFQSMGYRVGTVLSLKAQGQEAFLVQLTRN